MKVTFARGSGWEAPRLGFRSRFVLAKLGSSLREQFKDVLDQPLPESIERPVERLRGSSGVCPQTRRPR